MALLITYPVFMLSNNMSSQAPRMRRRGIPWSRAIEF